MAERLWLDDTRKPPWGYSLWARTADQCIEMLQAHEVEHCSLDHDLHADHYAFQFAPGYNEAEHPWDRASFKEKTGYAVIEWMIANDRWPPEIFVHSLSTGAEDMMAALRKHAPDWVNFSRVKPRDGK
jgi:hypothetical protein